MKKFFIIYLTLFSFKGYTQQLVISYEKRANVENQIKNITDEQFRKIAINAISKPVAYNLIYNNGESSFLALEKESNSNKKSKEIELTNGKNIRVIQLEKDNAGIYKNHITQEYLREVNLIGKDFLIKDSLPTIKWVILNDSKEIGDYLANKAIANIDDNEVIAWYTEEIPIQDGPYNYWGLPGLILEVEESSLSYHALSISFDSFEEPIKKPSKGKEVSLSEYSQIEKEKLEELKSSNGGVQRFGG